MSKALYPHPTTKISNLIFNNWLNIVVFCRNKRKAKTKSRIRRATTIYANNAVTTTEVKFGISDEYVALSSL